MRADYANVRDSEGSSALVHTLLNSDFAPALIAVLLDAGADVNTRDRRDRTVLMQAAAYVSMQSVQSFVCHLCDCIVSDRPILFTIFVTLTLVLQFCKHSPILFLHVLYV